MQSPAPHPQLMLMLQDIAKLRVCSAFKACKLFRYVCKFAKRLPTTDGIACAESGIVTTPALSGGGGWSQKVDCNKEKTNAMIEGVIQELQTGCLLNLGSAAHKRPLHRNQRKDTTTENSVKEKKRSSKSTNNKTKGEEEHNHSHQNDQATSP